MEFNFELPANLGAKLEEAARRLGETPKVLVVLAVAEKLARMEHETWLAETQASPRFADPQQSSAAESEELPAHSDKQRTK